MNAPDMQRVRMSLPHFREFGWDPHVLTVDDAGDTPIDPLLSATVPADVEVERVSSVPTSVAGAVGIGNIALRALPWLYRAGARAIARHDIDLVYFSTTMFLSMPLGRMWRRRFGTPYVLDMQDPWLSDYYATHPDTAPPPKYGLAHRLHATLEPWTMRDVGGLIAVSDTYLTTLRQRYPWIDEASCATIPFAASRADFDMLTAHPQANGVFQSGNGAVQALSVGRGGDDMRPALRVLFGAIRNGLSQAPAAFEPLRTYFVGTDYAAPDRARKTVEPVAAEFGLTDRVLEQTTRAPYFEALQLMKDADVLMLIGSDDPAYTASKVYPYLLARKPIVAVVHERSGLVPLLDHAASVLVTFSSANEAAAVIELTAKLRQFMEQRPAARELSPEIERACSARDMTRRQCELFDRVAGPALAA